MQLSQSNYLQHREQIDWSRMPAALVDKPKTVTDNAAAKGWADMGEQTQKATEQFFKLCNLLIAKDGSLVQSERASSSKQEHGPQNDLPFTPSPPTASATKQKRKPVTKEKKEKVTAPASNKLIIDLPRIIPQAKEVPMIATPNAFIKRYVGMHGKIKPREGRGSILELLHGLQKAITEGRISKSHHCSAEIGKMQSSLINLFYNMDERGKIEIDAQLLAHYKEIAQGEEVRTSVKLLKQFIQVNGKSPDKVKAEKLGKKLAAAYDTIPKEDPYRSELAAAAKSVAAYVSGETKMVGIPAATLHGLGGIASRSSLTGLGIVLGSGEGAVVRLLRDERVKNLSAASLKKAFRRTVAPGLCLEIAKSLMRRGELTMDVLNNPAVKKKSTALNGLGGEQTETGVGRITDLDILEMRLQNAARNSGAVTGLGNVETAPMFPAIRPSRNVEAQPEVLAPTETVSARDLAKMRFKTIGYNGRFKDVVGDPAVGFHMMVFGKPYNGKSSFVIELCKDLAELNKGKIAYLALEEGISLSMQKKVIDRGADKVDGLEFKGSMPASFEGYGFIVIDSISDRSISRETLREMFLNNPQTCFICIFHATKEGTARGGLDYSHDMDIIIKIEDHKPVVEKNRFL